MKFKIDPKNPILTFSDIESFTTDSFKDKYKFQDFGGIYKHVGIKKSDIIGVSVRFNEKKQEVNIQYAFPAIWARILFGSLLGIAIFHSQLKSLEVEVYNKLFERYGR